MHSLAPYPNPNLHLLLTWILKPSQDPQTALWSSFWKWGSGQNALTFQKCPHFQGLKLKLVLTKIDVQVHKHMLKLNGCNVRLLCMFEFICSFLCVNPPFQNQETLRLAIYFSVQTNLKKGCRQTPCSNFQRRIRTKITLKQSLKSILLCGCSQRLRHSS